MFLWSLELGFWNFHSVNTSSNVSTALASCALVDDQRRRETNHICVLAFRQNYMAAMQQRLHRTHGNPGRRLAIRQSQFHAGQQSSPRASARNFRL